jgi:3-oxoacyl-[acyl-carrier-protein] synthase-3
MERRAGIWGIGTYLPEKVRGNDWWPPSLVDQFRKRALHRTERVPLALSEGVRRALEAQEQYKDDPFNGAIERRVMKDDERSSDMEIIAAQRALENAKVAPSEIDAVISHTVCPDYIAGPTGAIVHHRLGLPQNCFTLSVDGACNSYPMLLTTADALIRSGTANRVLVINSCALSKLVPMEASFSPWMGDGAAATVVGPVSGDRGILSVAHGTEGNGYNALIFGVPGKRWYDEGRTVCYSENRDMAQSIILGAVDRSKEIVTEALARAGATPADVDFYAGHQGGPWLREVTQQFCGMHRARFVDTYTRFGNLNSTNGPLMLSIAVNEGLLHEGDLVATFSAGTGQVWSSAVIRWGRG